MAPRAAPFVLLDSSSGTGRSLLFEAPREIVTACTPEEAWPALERLHTAGAQGLHAAGFLSYELGYLLEPRLAPLLPRLRSVPLLWFGLFETVRELEPEAVERWLAERTRACFYRFGDVTPAWSEADYLRRFAEVEEKIAAGDIYQLNLTFPVSFRLEGSPVAFYRDLRRRQPVAYGGIVETGAATVLSLSPELFLTRTDRTVETRPMKGTAPRAASARADAAIRKELAADPKQRAENLMIVDLMRNDIGRIAEIGSVEVTDLFTVETYRTLHQLTSGVRARLRGDVSLLDLVRAVFPSGSVTGAPKIRAMELIAALESAPRGVYCGSIGHIAPGGDLQLNVAIRTPVIQRDGRGTMGIGSGVVADSVGAKEYAECLLKLKFLTDPPRGFQLIETLLFEPGTGYWLIDRHIERLAESARYFGFPCNRAAVRRALARAVKAKDSGRLRVRLLLDEAGKTTVTATPLPASQPASMRYVISPTRLHSRDPFLAHKTTRRELYDGEWQAYQAAYGADEVVYLNEKGEICEGSRTTIFVSVRGRLLTPPLSSGLLPGVLRAELLANGRAKEAVLHLRDLETADAVYLGNSVRGLVPAERMAMSEAAQ